MAESTMIARRQIRLAVLAALHSANLSAIIDSPGDWTVPPERLPALLVRASGCRKESITKGQPEFTTTVNIEIEAKVQGQTAEQAQDRIEQLCFQIENALLCNHNLIALCQQVVSVDTNSRISAEGRIHFGGAMMVFGFELFEAFDPFTEKLPPALESMGLHVDMASPFDANGTYPIGVFPDSVKPAPRTSGPDGRDEGALDIHFSQ